MDKPTSAGWYWWKSSPTASPIELKVSKADLEKYSKWGGEWYAFPSFNEVVESRKRMGVIEEAMRSNDAKVVRYNEAYKEMINFIVDVSTTMITPKKKIQTFLEELKKKSL